MLTIILSNSNIETDSLWMIEIRVCFSRFSRFGQSQPLRQNRRAIRNGFLFQDWGIFQPWSVQFIATCSRVYVLRRRITHTLLS